MNLNTTIDLDIKGFFQWWGKELAFLVPSKLRQAIRDRNGTLLFIPDEQGFTVNYLREDEQEVSLHKRLEYVDADAYQQLMAQNPGLEKAEHVLCLNQAQALHKVIYLPAATQENLQQVVSFELDRYTPFKLDQVYFSVVVLGKTELGQLQVLLILTPKLILDAQLDMLDSWQAHPQRVTYSLASSEFPQSEQAYNLLPNRYRQTVSKLEQSIHWLLSLAIALLTVAALVWPVWQESQTVDTLKNAIKALEKQTQVVEAQQHEIDALHAETQKLIDLKQKAPALLPVLDELTKLLQDDTWLTHLQYSDQHMQIQGQSPAASALIGLLEASEFFNSVSFVSPLTQDKTTGRERFQISMGVEMPAPEVAEEAPPADAAAEEQPADAADESDTAEEASDPAADELTEPDTTSQGEQP